MRSPNAIAHVPMTVVELLLLALLMLPVVIADKIMFIIYFDPRIVIRHINSKNVNVHTNISIEIERQNGEIPSLPWNIHHFMRKKVEKCGFGLSSILSVVVDDFQRNTFPLMNSSATRCMKCITSEVIVSCDSISNHKFNTQISNIRVEKKMRFVTKFHPFFDK